MADLKYQPVTHKHKEFLAKANGRPGFTEAYEALELEYAQSNAKLDKKPLSSDRQLKG